MSGALLVPIVAASLLGSVHCAAMCGSFVAAYSSADGGSRAGWAHAGYNGGRLVAYVTLGALGGALGRAVDLAGSALRVGNVAALVSGALMVLWGLSAMLATQGVRVTRFRSPAIVTRATSRLLASFHARPPFVRSLALGLSSALLPCGWLYAFVVTAAGTGSPWLGASVMLAFWAGTLPMLLGVGVLLQRGLTKLRAHVPILSATVILAVGVFTVLSRASLPAFAATVAPPSAAGAASPNLPSSSELPCHSRSAH